MASDSMEDKLWTLANAVTGFAVLQSVAFLYAATGDNHFRDIRLSSYLAKFGIALTSVLCGAIYCWAVWRTYVMAYSLEIEHKPIWRETTRGRIVAIVVFKSLDVMVLLGLPYALTTQ